MDDAKLKGMLREDAPAARDLAFELAVMARIERLAFHRALLRNIGVAALATLVLAVLAPSLQSLWQQDFAPAVGNLVIATLLMLATILAPYWAARRD